MITKHVVSRDDAIYEAWPDVALLPSGRMVCLFSECTHHRDRSYTRVMLTDSTDRGRTWTPKRPLTGATEGHPFYNCGRLSVLRDGRLAALVDRIDTPERSARPEDCHNLLWFSEDEGATWSDPVETPMRGIVPDKLLELESGRWILSSHYKDRESGRLVQRLWRSDDRGASWSGPAVVAKEADYNPCEVSILPVEGETLVAFLRENSNRGLDARKAISRDGGETWSAPVAFPLPGCHRPVSGFLRDGRILVTYRLHHGARADGFMAAHLFLGALTDVESALAPDRGGARVRLFPLDYDRSAHCDLGYSGWVQFDDGEIYVVNYIVDDAPNGQIRGYSFRPEDLVLEPA